MRRRCNCLPPGTGRQDLTAPGATLSSRSDRRDRRLAQGNARPDHGAAPLSIAPSSAADEFRDQDQVPNQLVARAPTRQQVAIGVASCHESPSHLFARHRSRTRTACGHLLCRLWHSPILVLCHVLPASTLERSPAKVGDVEARDHGRGALLAIESRPGGIALGRRGLPQGLGSASGLSSTSALPASGCIRLNARGQSAFAAAPGGNPHDGEIITHFPSCRSPMAFGCCSTRSLTAPGAGSSPTVELWNIECVGWHVPRRPVRRTLFSRCCWSLPGCMAPPRPVTAREGTRALLDHGLRVSETGQTIHQPQQAQGGRYTADPTRFRSPRPSAGQWRA